MIPRYIQCRKESWVMVSEFPDRTLCVEGIQSSEDAFMSQRTRFSFEAVKQLIPLMQEWVDEISAQQTTPSGRGKRSRR
jgi:hypothetical protein